MKFFLRGENYYIRIFLKKTFESILKAGLGDVSRRRKNLLKNAVWIFPNLQLAAVRIKMDN